MRDFLVGQYRPGNSWLHKVDPRIKLVTTMMVLLILFLVHAWASFALLVGLALVQWLLANLRFGLLLRAIKPVWILLAFTLVYHVFSSSKGIIHFGPMRLSSVGLRRGVILSVRLILLLWFSSLLTLTTPPMRLGEALVRLLAPLRVLKFPVDELAMMLMVALRFVPTLLQEAVILREAQWMRGSSLGRASFSRRLQEAASLLMPLLLGAIRKAEDLAEAMVSRGYVIGQKRTQRQLFMLAWTDWAYFLVVLVVVYSAWQVGLA